MTTAAADADRCPFSLFSDKLISAPYEHYEKLRSAPIHWSDELNVWIVASLDAVAFALNCPTLGAPRMAALIAEIGRRADRDYPSLIQFLEAALFFQSGERHRHDRRTVTAVMNRTALSDIEKVATTIAGNLADAIRRRDRYDVVREFAEPLPQLVMASILGLPFEDVPRLGELLPELTLAFDPASLATCGRIDRAIDEAAVLLVQRIDQAEAESGLGLIFARTAGEGAERLRAAAITTLFVFRVGVETTIGLTCGGGSSRIEALPRNWSQKFCASKAAFSVPGGSLSRIARSPASGSPQATACCSWSARPISTPRIFPTLPRSTWSGRASTMSPLASARIIAPARASPGSKGGSPSRRC
jgi:cytochrome P450